MQFVFEKGDVTKIKACDALVLLVDEAWQKSDAVTELDKLVDGELVKRAKRADFSGKLHASFTLQSFYKTKYDRIVLWGVGDGELDAEGLWDAGHKLVAKLRSKSIDSVTIAFTVGADASATAFITKLAQGAVSGEYRFDRYRPETAKENKARDLKKVTLFAMGENAPTPAKGKAAMERGVTLGDAVNFARGLINEPAETMTPQIFADVITKMGKGAGIQVKVETEAQIKRRKMGLFMAVARGSKNPPRLITATYNPKGAKGKPIVLVGKGLMFDSGGYSLKPSSGMETMKCDMSGSAAVMGAIYALATLGVKRKVIAVVAACENMIGGGAYRVGDVFVGMNGKSVEIMNTDAEGRLTLADALTYAQSFKPELVVDVATLTGACVVALGEQTVGVFASDDARDDVLSAFERAGEDAWQLPLNPRLKNLLKSDIADMKNVGGRWGGAITAGLFLQAFVDDKQKWAHLDIAGPAFNTSVVGHMPKGGSGVAVSTLVELVDPTE